MQQLVGRPCVFMRHPMLRAENPQTSHHICLFSASKYAASRGQQLWAATVPRSCSPAEATQEADLLSSRIPCEIFRKGVRKGSQEVYGISETTVILQLGLAVLSGSLVELLSLKNCLFHISVCLCHNFSSHFESNQTES